MIRDLAWGAVGALTILVVAAIVLLFEPTYARSAETICGTASWYGGESGNRTYTGDAFDGSSLTAAMPSTRHIGERWLVTYRGRSVVVRVNDYGPAAYLHRVIDLSREAARRLGLLQAGTGTVCMVRQ